MPGFLNGISDAHPLLSATHAKTSSMLPYHLQGTSTLMGSHQPSSSRVTLTLSPGRYGQSPEHMAFRASISHKQQACASKSQAPLVRLHRNLLRHAQGAEQGCNHNLCAQHACQPTRCPAGAPAQGAPAPCAATLRTRAVVRAALPPHPGCAAVGSSREALPRDPMLGMQRRRVHGLDAASAPVAACVQEMSRQVACTGALQAS